MAEKSLVITIKAKVDDILAGLKRVTDQSEKLESQLAGAAKVSGVAFAALTGVVALSVAKFAEFEKGFTNVVTLLDDGSFKTKTLTQGIASLKKGVMDLSVTTGESFDKLNKGLFDLISAGIPADKAMSVLAAATDLAAAGATDTAVAVDGLTSSLNAYGLSADQAKNVSEKFFTAQKNGKTTVEQMAAGFGLVGPAAAGMGISLNELLGSVAAVTNSGLQTNAAYTGMKAALTNILKPTDDAAKEARRLGIEFNSTALKSQGLEKFLKSITGSAKYTDESISKLFGSSEAFNFVLALAGPQAQTFTKILADLGDQAVLDANYDRALAAAKETVAKAFERITQSASSAAAVLGEKFAPIILSLSDSVVKMTKWFMGLDDVWVTTIAKAVEFATIFAGLIFSFTAVGLGAVKAISIFKDLQGAFVIFTGIAEGSAIAFAGWTAVATGGLSLVLAFLPEIIGALKEAIPWWQEFFGVATGPEAKAAATALDDNKAAIAKTQDAIKELTPKWKEAQGAQKDYYRDLLLNAYAGLAALKKQQEELGKGPDGKPASAAAAKEDPAIAAAKAKKKAIALETLEQIENAKNANAILLAQQQGATAEEIDILKQKFELKKNLENANGIANDELRALELAKIETQNQMLMVKAQEIADKKIAFQTEQGGLSEAARDGLMLRDLTALQASIETKTQMESDYQRSIIEKKRAAQKQQFDDAQKYGAAYAALNSVINSDEVKAFASTASTLSALQNSKNEEMKKVGKAAAIVQIGIQTAVGAISAYASLAPIPIIGPVLGAAAAGFVIAYGAEQVATVTGAAKGSLVGGIGVGDKVPYNLERGELVVPEKATNQFLPVLAREQNKIESSDQNNNQNQGVNEIGIRLLDRAEDFITVEQQKKQALGIF